MAGEQTRAAVFAQPERLREVPGRVGDRRFPEARIAFAGCGTSYHAALAGADLAGGEAWQALELVLRPPRADLLVVVSHDGKTALSLEAARAFGGPVWLVTGRPDGPIADLADEVIVTGPEAESSWCHTVSYTTALAVVAVLAGHDVSGLPEAVEGALGEHLPITDHQRYVVVGAGRDWPTAQEAVLKLREGVFVAAEAHQTEQLLHGHLAAVDETVRALRELGVDTTVLPQSPDPAARPILGVVPFHLLVLDLAERRGVNPDRIHRDDERWARARAAYT